MEHSYAWMPAYRIWPKSRHTISDSEDTAGTEDSTSDRVLARAQTRTVACE